MSRSAALVVDHELILKALHHHALAPGHRSIKRALTIRYAPARAYRDRNRDARSCGGQRLRPLAPSQHRANQGLDRRGSLGQRARDHAIDADLHRGRGHPDRIQLERLIALLRETAVISFAALSCSTSDRSPPKITTRLRLSTSPRCHRPSDGNRSTHAAQPEPTKTMTVGRPVSRRSASEPYCRESARARTPAPRSRAEAPAAPWPRRPARARDQAAGGRPQLRDSQRESDRSRQRRHERELGRVEVAEPAIDTRARSGYHDERSGGSRTRLRITVAAPTGSESIRPKQSQSGLFPAPARARYRRRTPRAAAQRHATSSPASGRPDQQCGGDGQFGERQRRSADPSPRA